MPLLDPSPLRVRRLRLYVLPFFYTCTRACILFLVPHVFIRRGHFQSSVVLACALSWARRSVLQVDFHVLRVLMVYRTSSTIGPRRAYILR